MGNAAWYRINIPETNSNIGLGIHVILLTSRLCQSRALCLHSLGFDERFYHVFYTFLYISGENQSFFPAAAVMDCGVRDES